MATISREAALAMIAQVERQAGVITRRYTGNEVILDRFSDFRAFIDALSEFHLFIDMVENRLTAFGPSDRPSQARKLATIRSKILALELEMTSLFLDRMATHDRPWPMGSQKFLRRRLTRLEDIAAFHAAHGKDYDLAPPDAAQMQTIRDRVAAQIDNSVALADFAAAPPPPAVEPVAEEPAPELPETIIEPPAPPQAPAPVIETPSPAEPKPATPQPAPPPPVQTQPDVMIPGMGFAAPVSPLSAPQASSSEPSVAKAPKPLAAAPMLPELMIPGMIMPAPPTPAPAAAPPPPVSPPPATSPVTPPVTPSTTSTAPEILDFDAEYVAQKAQEVAKLAATVAKPVAQTGTPGLARRDFRLQVRSEADGYQYIDGNGLAVLSESCRVANTTIDELAKTLELSRPGLVLILNGKDPVGPDLLKTLRRFVRRTGGLA